MSQNKARQGNAKHQSDLRKRRSKAGFAEVRGLYLPTEKHAEIKQELRKLYPLDGLNRTN